MVGQVIAECMCVFVCCCAMAMYWGRLCGDSWSRWMTCTGERIYFAARRRGEICYSPALPTFSHCSTSLGPYFIPAPPIPKQIYLQTPPVHTYPHFNTCTHAATDSCTHADAGEDHKHTFPKNQTREHTQNAFLTCFPEEV